jgi:hypothetical protein
VRESVSVKFRRDPAERFRPERFFGERWIPERERNFPAKSGGDSVERRTAGRRRERFAGEENKEREGGRRRGTFGF